LAEWIAAAFVGTAGVLAMFGLAWMRGVSPRRLAWQDLSLVRKPDQAEREVLRSHIKSSLKIYLPILAGAVIVGGLMLADGMPFGLAVLICFGVPPLLALVRAARVLRFLREA
jgi:hypothetical protein